MAQSNLHNTKWFRKILLGWFNKYGRSFLWRKKNCTRYQLVIAEVLLQRTKAETVSVFFTNFIKHFPSWKVLHETKIRDLQVFLKPIGLWKQRAVSLKALSQEMTKRNGRFPKTREEIEKLPGVGQYVANAIELFCYNRPRPLIDVNMARVLERFFGPRKLADIRYDPYLQKLAQDIMPRKMVREFNWAILDFAATVCTIRKPACPSCPLSSRCLFFKRNKKTCRN